MTNVTPPPDFGSQTNYVIGSSNGDPLQDLKITIAITEDLVSNLGLSFQLNGYSPYQLHGSPAGGYLSSWQQYVLMMQTGTYAALTPNVVIAKVEPWPTTGPNLLNQNYGLNDATLTVNESGFLVIPKDSKFEISLGTDDSQNIRYVTFAYTDSHGVQHKTTPSTVDVLALAQQKKKGLAPLCAFQLDVVGPVNSLQTYLQSGKGTITYSASKPLTAYTDGNHFQSATGVTLDTQEGTAETANSSYGQLPEGSDTSITQTFAAADIGVFAPGAFIAAAGWASGPVTSVYGINQAGQLAVCSVEGSGHWKWLTPASPVGPQGFALRGGFGLRGSGIAASPLFGLDNLFFAYVVGQNAQLYSLQVSNAPDGAIYPAAISPAGAVPQGSYLAASQQFGVTEQGPGGQSVGGQTDVFLIDWNTALVMYSETVTAFAGIGNFTGPHAISAQNLFPGNAPIAVSQQFGAAEQTDVFVVDNTGTLQLFWANGPGEWGGPIPVSPYGFLAAGQPAGVAASQQFGSGDGKQTDVFVVDKNGTLNVFWVEGPPLEFEWKGPLAISGKNFAPPGAFIAASQQFGSTDQTDVFVVDNSGTLTVCWVNGAGKWKGPKTLTGKNFAPPGAPVAASRQFGLDQTDVFVIDNKGNPNVCWVDSAGNWNGPKVLVAEV